MVLTPESSIDDYYRELYTFRLSLMYSAASTGRTELVRAIVRGDDHLILESVRSDRGALASSTREKWAMYNEFIVNPLRMVDVEQKVAEALEPLNFVYKLISSLVDYAVAYAIGVVTFEEAITKYEEIKANTPEDAEPVSGNHDHHHVVLLVGLDNRSVGTHIY